MAVEAWPVLGVAVGGGVLVLDELWEEGQFGVSDGGVVAGVVGAVVGRRSSLVLEMLLAERLDGRGASRLAVEVGAPRREADKDVTGEAVRMDRDRERLYSLMGLRNMPPAASAMPAAVDIDAEDTAVSGSQRRFSMYIGFGLYLHDIVKQSPMKVLRGLTA